jgi:hypothetical protein
VSCFGDGWSCTPADEIVTCTNLGPIAPGATSVITLAVNVGDAAWPGVTNFAIVDNSSDRNTANNAVGNPTAVVRGQK